MQASVLLDSKSFRAPQYISSVFTSVTWICRSIKQAEQHNAHDSRAGAATTAAAGLREASCAAAVQSVEQQTERADFHARHSLVSYSPLQEQDSYFQFMAASAFICVPAFFFVSRLPFAPPIFAACSLK